jgi:hypothetical protein
LACVKRPVAYSDVEAVAEAVRTRVMQSARSEVSSEDLGGWVLERLRPIDSVAAFRFASVFRRPNDVQALRRELAALEAEPTVPAPDAALVTQPTLPGMPPTRAGGGAGKRVAPAVIAGSSEAAAPRETGD